MAEGKAQRRRNGCEKASGQGVEIDFGIHCTFDIDDVSDDYRIYCHDWHSRPGDHGWIHAVLTFDDQGRP